MEGSGRGLIVLEGLSKIANHLRIAGAWAEIKSTTNLENCRYTNLLGIYTSMIFFILLFISVSLTFFSDIPFFFCS
jgi:hypothetical protein